MEVLKKTPVMAIQDDFDVHFASDWKRDTGKLLLVDQADYNTQHIFFDDNAVDNDYCIVDARDVITGQQIPHETAMNSYVVKVHPQRAILESDYFVKLIDQCVLNRDEEIRKAENEVLAPDVSSEWEQI